MWHTSRTPKWRINSVMKTHKMFWFPHNSLNRKIPQRECNLTEVQLVSWVINTEKLVRWLSGRVCHVSVMARVQFLRDPVKPGTVAGVYNPCVPVARWAVETGEIPEILWPDSLAHVAQRTTNRPCQGKSKGNTWSCFPISTCIPL